MRRSRWLLIGGLMLVLAMAGLGIQRAAQDEGPTRVMLVGDSLTQGTQGDYTWRYFLWDALRRDKADVDFVGPRTGLWDQFESGTPGHAYADPEFDQDHAANYEATFADPVQPVGDLVRDLAPDVVVVMLGYDDLLRVGSTPEATVEAAGDLIAEVRADRPETSFVLVTCPLGWITEVKEFNDGLVEAAREWDQRDSAVTVARADEDFSQSVYGLVGDTWDGVHPNTKGQIKVANAVSRALVDLGIGQGAQRAPDSFPNGVREPATIKSVDVVRGAKGPVAEVRWELPPGATAGQLWLRNTAQGDTLLKYGEPQAFGIDVKGLDGGQTYEFLVQAMKWQVPVEPDMNSETTQARMVVSRG